MRNFIFFVGILIINCSCEDVIEVDINDGKIQLCVDAFINNKKETQKIILKKTKQFFDNTEQFPFKADSVYISDSSGNKFIFKDIDDTGEYTWNDSDSSFVKVGNEYTLTIKASDSTYTSTSEVFPVANVDSINWIYAPPLFEGQLGTYIVEGVIMDLAGQDDYTWVRVKINGDYILKKSSIIVAKNNSNVGLGVDGELFIPPAAWYQPRGKETINIGDVVTFETWSFSEQTALFWQEVFNQNIDGAFSAIFATPTSNVMTNIISNSNKSENNAVGWFSVSIVSQESVTIYDKPGEELSFPN
jgi:hypothetical protein